MSSSVFIADLVASEMPRHSRLTMALVEVEGCVEELEQQKTSVADLERRLAECEVDLKQSTERTQKERKVVENASRSPFSKKITSFFRVGARGADSNTTPTYITALQLEVRGREKRDFLAESLAIGRKTLNELTPKADKCMSLRVQLSKLYAGVFDGPTPGFPEEDELEQKTRAADAVYQKLKIGLQTESLVSGALEDAQGCLVECENHLKDALYWATASLLGARLGESQAMALENNSLHKALKGARDLARLADTHTRAAREYSKDIKNLRLLSIAQDPGPYSKFADILKGDGNYNDINQFHEQLKKASSEVTDVLEEVSAECKASQLRTSNTKTIVDQMSSTVTEYQRELDSLRLKIFEAIGSQLRERDESRKRMSSVPLEAPPPIYQDNRHLHEQQHQQQQYQQPFQQSYPQSYPDTQQPHYPQYQQVQPQQHQFYSHQDMNVAITTQHLHNLHIDTADFDDQGPAPGAQLHNLYQQREAAGLSPTKSARQSSRRRLPPIPQSLPR